MHDWGRLEDGSPPTHKDRNKGKALSDEEKIEDRSNAPQESETESQSGENAQEDENQGGDPGAQME